MKKSCLAMILFIFLVVGCTGKSGTPPEAVVFSETQHEQGREDTASVPVVNHADSTEKETLCPFSGYWGTYLPEIYIRELQNVKSHKKATKIFRDRDNDNPNVFFLNEEYLEGIVNFHEGWGEKIVKYEQGYLYTKSDETVKRYKLEDGETIIAGNTRFKKIDSSITAINDDIIGTYIVQTLFKDLRLNNGRASFKEEHNRIIYGGTDYTYETALVFTSPVHDCILTSDHKYKYIEVSDDCINIYNAIIPEEDADDPFAILSASYQLENAFTLQ